jgi:hypothetical protein
MYQIYVINAREKRGRYIYKTRMSAGSTTACAGQRMGLDRKLLLVNGELVCLKDRDLIEDRSCGFLHILLWIVYQVGS